MAKSTEVLVPDIGGFKDVSVIDVLVKVGQLIEKETPLVTIETEKAAMDVPAPAAGTVTQLKLKIGDKVSQGSAILLLQTNEDDASAASTSAPVSAPAAPTVHAATAATATATAAESVAVDPPATKPAPAPAQSAAVATPPPAPPAAAAPAPAPSKPQAPVAPAAPRQGSPAAAAQPAAAAGIDEKGFSQAHASPSARRFARELGTDLTRVKGTGIKGRILPEDVKAYVKGLLTAAAANASKTSTAKTGTTVAPASSGLPKVPAVDFAAFGSVETKPLTRIQKISGARLQASWLNLPHVTQHDDADITDLEAVRNALKDKASQEGVRLTPLTFIIKACIAALQQFPRFNSSLDSSGESLVLKKYYNIGFAADTPNGLMVPVITNADRMTIYEIARNLGQLSERARAGKLKAAEMQGGTFTISSLGGIGGTAFTPIINAPEVAILGVSKSSQKPVYERGGFIPRLMLPLSLSYDHRVIDGAEAARFVVFLAKVLGDVKALT